MWCVDGQVMAKKKGEPPSTLRQSVVPYLAAARASLIH